jgi:hypothetical protein
VHCYGSPDPESLEALYSSDCVFIWHQFLLNKTIIKQFILFYAAHTYNHSFSSDFNAVVVFAPAGQLYTRRLRPTRLKMCEYVDL